TEPDEQPAGEQQRPADFRFETCGANHRIVGLRPDGDTFHDEVDVIRDVACEVERDHWSSRDGNEVPSCQRAIVHSRSERRLRYGTTYESSVAATSAWRSARRTTVRATSSKAAMRFSPGTTNSVGGSNRADSASIDASSAATISFVTRFFAAVS